MRITWRREWTVEVPDDTADVEQYITDTAIDEIALTDESYVVDTEAEAHEHNQTMTDLYQMENLHGETMNRLRLMQESIDRYNAVEDKLSYDPEGATAQELLRQISAAIEEMENQS